MKRRFVAAGLAGLLLALGWLAGLGAAEAQPLPPGSYLRSCRDAQVRGGGNLVAFCATRNGQWVGARLNDFPSCRGDISNQNGQLWCERRPAPPPPGPPPGPHGFGPPGSYNRSCTRIEFRNGVLSAFCRTVMGNWQPSVLNTLNCEPRADISNQNGTLTCPPRRQMPPPPGSYLQTCRNVTVGGAGMLRAQCQRVNGLWNPTALNLNQCRPGRDISNQNGNLVCR
ncbi:CVNH domain-containing protein [Xanthobacter autotrophicus DSM 431]|uniref:CVNH domain-containing protein n=1 Tax=Xanthobacter nonsaccharivorans TaxID=3119912 RepID=UPI003726E34C